MYRFERALIVGALARAALLAVLIANGVAVFEVLRAWRGDLFAAFLAVGIESVVLIATHIVAVRLTFNTTRRKSDPAQPIGAVLCILAFFALLSGVGNAHYLLTSGADWFAALLYGASAPLAAGFIAYLFGEEAAIQRRQSDHEAALEQRAKQRKATRVARKAEPKREKPPESGFVCPACGTVYATQAQLNGHGPERCARKRAAESANHRERETVKDDVS